MAGKGQSRERVKASQSRINARYVDLLAGLGIGPEDLPDDLKGNPVRIPQVNFDVSLEQKVMARMGPPPYAVRARLVEDLILKLEDELAAKWKMIARSCPDQPERFVKVWKAIVETLELDELNQLIAEHNRFYPIEANLREHPETGEIMIGNTPFKPKPKLTPGALLKKFPPDLAAALRSTGDG